MKIGDIVYRRGYKQPIKLVRQRGDDWECSWKDGFDQPQKGTYKHSELVCEEPRQPVRNS